MRNYYPIRVGTLVRERTERKTNRDNTLIKHSQKYTSIRD